MVSIRNAALCAVFGLSMSAAGWGGDWCNWNYCGWKKARAIPFGNPALDVVKREPAAKEKRQGGGYTYTVSSPLPDFAAMPYQTCGGSKICPNGWYCNCQTPGSSLCMSITNPSCSVYAGATDFVQCNFYWPSTSTAHATAFGQCGGYIGRDINQPWEIRTVCPNDFHCVCGDFWYSQCLPVATPAGCTGGASRYWGCGNEVYTSPQGVGQQCGGHCFKAQGANGNCPAGLSCYTQTASSPGFVAICDTASPTAAGQWDPYAQSLCYPIPFEWSGAGAPVCGGARKRDEYSYMMTKPSRVPANSPAEATPPTDFSEPAPQAATGQQVTL